MLEAVTIATLFIMFVSILVGVIDRFVLGLSFPWPEELGRFLLVWGSLLAAAVAAKRSQHFQLTFFIRRFGVAGAVHALSDGAAGRQRCGRGVRSASPWLFPDDQGERAAFA